MGMCMHPRVCVCALVKLNFRRRRAWGCELIVCVYCDCVLVSLCLCFCLCDLCVIVSLSVRKCVFMCLTV